MAGYGTDTLPGRVIYPSSRLALYSAVLVVSKILRAAGLFIAYDLLKLIPIVLFLFFLKLGSAVIIVFLQKPFTSGRRLTKNQWFRVGRHALFGSLISFLWLFGLTLCGPLRTILLFEHSDLVIIAGASALFHGTGGPAKTRGAVFFLVAVIVLLLFDHDEKVGLMTESEVEHIHHTFVSHIFNHAVDFVGWSDHKGGVVLLFITLCLHVGYNSASKKLSVEVGGAKRLHAFSSLVSALLLWPWAGFTYLTTETEVHSWLNTIIPLLIVILTVCIIDYYIENVAISHLQGARVAFYSSVAMFGGAIFFSYTWNHPYVTKATTLHKIKDIVTEDHVLSGGVIFSVLIFILAARMLLSAGRAAKGSFIGYSPAGIPLYSFSSDAFHKTSHSLMLVLRNGLRQILEESDSRKIFYFLCVNLGFTFVELLYGAWTNSLGLISDGFHMMFDCSALVMGLYAAVMSRWKATRLFSFGYDRVEVLSGFINGLFLIVVGIFVFTEALTRLFEPPEVKTERLLTVSALGLIVNLFGIFAFQSSVSHHGHSHGGVFLHVLADTMGSVGVIVSSLLIENFGWNIADPICSLFIATLILLSVIPLLKETTAILLLRTPTGMDTVLEEAFQKILAVDGVLSYRDPHIWNHTSTKVMATLHVQISSSAVEQRVISQHILRKRTLALNKVTEMLLDLLWADLFSVQGGWCTYFDSASRKRLIFFHMSGLGAVMDQTAPVSFSLTKVTLTEPASVI
ncbi:hypothetical protein C0Q70_20608 [Pomacea canaliculata]|uniref:Proton-coupled zinc antiporter SLC30A5 n=1 Tax=Pomacea canaliculata TaxID=400727 RepID=A0A2T7NG15_POMCA|nr:hypothetical protein C0Q70_20608 [Pomacea canaliculata]